MNKRVGAIDYLKLRLALKISTLLESRTTDPLIVEVLDYIRKRTSRKATVATLIAIMAANAGFNWVFFRRRNLRGSFLYYIPYSALVAVLIVLLVQVEGMLALIFLVYACYLPYAMLWSHRVWKLNAHKGESL